MNLVSALWLTVIVAGWCMVPESLVVGALSLIAMGLVYWERHDATARIETEMATALQTIVEELKPWWVDGPEVQMEMPVQTDAMASNVRLRDRDRIEDSPHRSAPVSGFASQTGLFSRKSDDKARGDVLHGCGSSRHVDFNECYKHEVYV